MTLPPHLRNPWKGIDTWKEFKYDMRHPVLWVKRGNQGILGNNKEEVSKFERIVGTGMIIQGGIMFLVGFGLMVLSYST